MNRYRTPLILVAILLALLALISAYLAYSQAAILDRYLKRLMVEPDFRGFIENNQLIIWFSVVILIGQLVLWWLAGKWLVRYYQGHSSDGNLLVPGVQMIVVYRLATSIWGRLEYQAKEANEFHRYQRWNRFYGWLWSLIIAIVLIAAGAIWLALLPQNLALTASASAMSYVLTLLSAGHALAALSLLFTIAIVAQLEGRISDNPDWD